MADEVPDSAVVPTALAYTLGGDPGVRNPELAEKYRNEYKTRGEKFALDYEDVMSKRQAEVENAKRILDETAAALRAGHTGEGPGQMNLPLLQMAAGFFKPTRSGNFGEEFGNALSGLAGGIGNQRMRDDEFNRGMADLTLKRSSFEQEPLKDRAALLKAQQLQQEKGQQAIETAQIKTAGGAGLSPIAKIKADVLAGRMTREEGDAAIKKLTHVGGAGSPDTQAYNAALQYHVDHGGKKEDFPSPDVWKAQREGAIATEKERGKSIAEAWEALPKLEAEADRFRSEINNLLSDTNKPKLLELIGKYAGRVPAWGVFDPALQDILSSLDTLGAMTFGQSVATMKGLGALSNAEGAKIQDILGKLNRKGTPEEFVRRLEEMRDRSSKVGAEIAKKKTEWTANPPGGISTGTGAAPPAVDYEKLYGMKPRG